MNENLDDDIPDIFLQNIDVFIEGNVPIFIICSVAFILAQGQMC